MTLVALLICFVYAWAVVTTSFGWRCWQQGYPTWLAVLFPLLPFLALIVGLHVGR